MSSGTPTPTPSDRPPSFHSRKYGTRNPLTRLLSARFLDRVLAEVDEIRPGRIVEIGCGEGRITAELDRLDLEIDYVGYDIDPEAVAIAVRRYPDKTFRQADLLQLRPPQDQTHADLVLCLEVLEHLPEPAGAVKIVAAAFGEVRVRTAFP